METVLIPSSRQALWGKPAVANFFLGGAGAGAYATAAVLSGFERTPLLRTTSALGPLLVMAGLLAVAFEAGRPFRALYLLRRLRSSWMSRELLFGSAFLVMALLEFVRPLTVHRITASVAAVLFMLAQGFIPARAKGIAAWRVPVLPALFVASGLVSGAGLLGVLQPIAGSEAVKLDLAIAGLILASALLWGTYLLWPGGAAFRSATAALRDDNALLGIFVAGHFLPLLFLVAGLKAEAIAQYGVAAGGVGILAGQLHGKAWLILRAGALRPITIPSRQRSAAS